MKIFPKKKSNIPKRRSVQNTDIISGGSNVYKRNRTLTNQAPNRLNTTDSHSDLKSPRTYVHRLSVQRRKIVSLLIILIICAIPLWLLLFNFTADVNVRLSENGTTKPIDSKKYQEAIQSYLDQNPISRINLFLNQSHLSDFISTKLPEVASVSKGTMTGVGNTSFAILMRPPVAGWQINGKQYYVDSKGYPFDINYFPAPSVQIIDNSGISYKIGTTAIASNRFLGFIGRVVSLTKSGGYTVSQALLPPNTTRELDIRLKEVSYYIKYSIDRPAGEQVEDMVEAIKYFSARGQSPKYIDVRVSGKGFYR